MKRLNHGVQFIIGGLILLASASPLNAARLASAEPDAPDTASLQAFQLVTPVSGWVLMGQHLYWTANGGGGWAQITPSNMGTDLIRAVTFSNPQRGWLITTSPADTGLPSYHLARTSDAGHTWQTALLNLFASGDASALAGAVFLQFLDARTGWLVVKRATSSNFSLGALFTTTDGGDTWARLSIPIGAPVRFTSEQDGSVEDSARGTGRYISHDGGKIWTLQTSGIPTAGPSPGPQGLSQISMATPQAGWARRAVGKCEAQVCVLLTQLLRTADGGQNWAPVTLPDGRQSIQQTFKAPGSPAAPQSAGGLSLTFGGAGFDACTIRTLPALAGMQNWFVSSPYRVWNLYIGGASRANCGVLTAAYVQQLAQQGWLFIPTWVGPQAPCTTYSHKISPDPTTAYSQGVVEADLALAAASSLGLTLPDQSGTVVYFDLEYYTGDQACRDATKSFISGWTGELRAKGNQAGVYAAPCGGYFEDFVSISNVPDMVWPAVWSFSGYDPGASVWNLPCLGNSLWVNAQRLRQYTGGHDETWNGLTYNIDSDVINGSVATVAGTCFPAANQVALFVYPNFAGQCVVKDIGGYPAAAALSLPPNSISSVRVGTNVSLRLCRGESYTGLCQDFSADDSNLGNDPLGDNQASSAAVQTSTLAFTHHVWLPGVLVNAGFTTPLPNRN
jgi:photosystem II stability/assembly factor-like uncharacterized protein